MTVTYMFRARNREARGLAQGDALASATPGESARAPETPNPMPAPDAHVPEVAPAAPLVLGNRVDDAPLPRPADAAQDARIILSAMPVPAKLPANYVACEGRIFLVAKARGGIGATTLAVNLALEMQVQVARRGGAGGGRVALVDLDVQLGNAGSFLDLADRGGMLALARLGPEPDAQAVRHAMVRHPTGLNVLAAPSMAIPFEAFDGRRIGFMLDALAAENDVVVVDLPPALIDWLEPLLARADRLLMVTDLAVPSIVRARRVIAMMTEDHPKLPVDILVAHEKKPFRMGQTHRDAETALGHRLRYWLPDETKLARQALDRGEPLVQLAPRCGWSKAVRTIAAELLTSPRTGAKPHDQGNH